MKLIWKLNILILSFIFFCSFSSAYAGCYDGERYTGGWVFLQMKMCYDYNYNSYGGFESVSVYCIPDSNADYLTQQLYVDPSSRSCSKSGCNGQALPNEIMPLIQGQTSYKATCWAYGTRENSNGGTDWVWTQMGLDWSTLKYTECSSGRTKEDALGYFNCVNNFWNRLGECRTGAEKTSGQEYFRCENYNWVKKQCKSGTAQTVGNNYFICKNNLWEQQECALNQTKCNGTDSYVCDSNFKWKNNGKELDKCGVQCVTLNSSRCLGNNFNSCENYLWKDKGIILNKCNVTCTSSSQCSQTSNDTYICSGDNLVKSIQQPSCENYACKYSLTSETKKCSSGCDATINKCKDNVLIQIWNWLRSLFLRN